MKVEDSRYVFEAKTIKRMEILVLSTLGWKMNPPTPLSFLDYITRRLGLKKDYRLCLEFLKRCEALLLSLITGNYSLAIYIFQLLLLISMCFSKCRRYSSNNMVDSGFLSYLPSELATATMMHVINSVEPRLRVEYQNQLLGILGINKVSNSWPSL